MKNVYLIGMMGSGKTTTGRVLAKLLSIPFVDLDERIVQKAGHSINEIFKNQGGRYFRDLETEALINVSKSSNQIVATGGGIVINPENRARLKNTGLVIYLKTSTGVLWERVKEKKDRPLLATSNPKQTFLELFQSRTPLYIENSQKSFLTDHKTPEAVAKEIYQACFNEKN